ncbi:MAG: PAS domain S-box protein [Anaerolineae bacterium]|nr:PAS domain S-box protein [Anaerolineae bacterium]
MDAYKLLLVATPSDDLATIRAVLQAAALPEPLTYLVQADEEAPSLYILAYDVILLKYGALQHCCKKLTGHFQDHLPDVPIILLVNAEERTTAEQLIENSHVLVFDYTQTEPYMLRQLVQFLTRQRRQRHDLERNLQAFSDRSRLLDSLINRNADGMLVIDQDGVIRFANPAAAALFGRDNLVSMPFGFPLLLGHMAEIDLFRADGRECVAEMRLVMTEWEGRPAYLATLRDVTERSLAERRLHYRFALESLLATISAQFVSLPTAEVDARISEALALLGDFIGAERVLLTDLSRTPSECAITHIWEASHVVGRYPSIDPEVPYRFYTRVFQEQDILLIPDTEQLPVEQPERPFMIARGVRTLMAIAMRYRGELRGSLTFVAISQTRPWQYEDAALLSIAADVFASALRRAEINRALRQSEARLRFVINSAPLILFTFDTNGVIDFLEGALLDRHFPRLRELVGQSAFGDIYIGEHLRAVLQGETRRFVFKPSEEATLEIRLMPLRDEAGVVVGGIGMIIDVTERQRAQEAEQRQAMLLRTLAEASLKLTSSLQLERVLETILEYAERLVPSDGSSVVLLSHNSVVASVARGRSADLTPRRWQEIVARLDLQAHWVRLKQASNCSLIPDTAVEPSWIPIEGTEWVKSYLGLPIELEGHVIGVMNFDSATPNYFTLEHAERLKALAGYAAIAIQNANLYETIQRNAKDLERHVRQRTAELEIERARLRTILDSMEEGVIFFELRDTWRATYVNPSFHRIFGYSETEFVGQALLDIAANFPVPEGAPSLEELGQILERDGSWHGEFRYRRRDGSSFDAYVAASRILGARGKLVGTVVLVRDISKEKALQEQKDRFIANAAHELRTPLTNLKMRLYLLRRQPEAAETHMSVLEQVTRRMQMLVEDLLDVTRFERGMIVLRRERLCLAELLENVIHVQLPHFEHKRVQLTSSLPPDGVFVLADAERLTQVFTNLLVNALNYTETGGNVRVSLRQDESSAVVEVEDNGIGIDSESLKRIFEPFFRANLGTQRGTGLGLTIAREIVQSHGGSIEARSQLGVGTTMIVSLPLAD